MRCLSLTRFVLSLAAALLAVGVCAPRAQASFILNKPSALGLNNSLVGWWTFDERNMDQNYAHDASGNGNRGTLNTTAGTETFSTSASTTYTVPQGVRFITVETWGAGGEGGVGLSGSDGGGGGGGGYAKKVINVNPGEILNLSIGAGGSGSTDVKGKPGGDSYVADASSILVRACGGGGGGASADNGSVGGLAGAGGTIACGTGDVEFAGGDGGPGENGTDGDGAGGGEGACDNGNGAVGGTPGTNGGAGGSGGCTGTGGGNGGGGGNNGASGTNGTAGGGGGGAGEGTTLSGGDGAAGQITITDDAPDPQRVPGKIGQGLAFDGMDDNVQLPSSFNSFSSWSFAHWVYSREAPTGDSLQPFNNREAFGFIWDHADSTFATAVFILNQAGTVYTKAKLTSTLQANTWYFIAGTWDGVTLRAYLNGVQEASAPVSGAIWAGQNTATIGANPTNVANFSGLIDDVRIYNRALSADEIKRLYNMGGTVKLNTSRSTGSLATGLVGWWTFDGKDISGAVGGATPRQIYDRSGSGKVGKYYNATTTPPAIGKIGQTLEFDGVDDYVTAGNAGSGIKTIAFWMKAPDVTSKKIINIDGSDQIETNGSGQIVATSFPAASVYVDGAVASAVQNNKWHHVVITDTTGVSGSLFEIGRVSTTYFPGLIDDVRIYNRALSADEIKRLYNMGGTVKLNKTSNSLTNGLVGWWTFDGKDISGVQAYDKSGNGNRGILTSGPVRGIGKIGQGMQFDGVDDYVDVSNESNFDFSSSYTISAWFKTGSSKGYQDLATKGDGGSGFNDNFLMRVDTQVYGGKLFGRMGRGGAEDTLAGNTTVTDNNWHHGVFIYNASTAKLYLYVDGQQDATPVSTGGSPNLNNNDVYIGGWATFTTGRFLGLIDDVRIYNRALTPDEVKRLYNMGR